MTNKLILEMSIVFCFPTQRMAVCNFLGLFVSFLVNGQSVYASDIILGNFNLVPFLRLQFFSVSFLLAVPKVAI